MRKLRKDRPALVEPAGTLGEDGYIHIEIDGQDYYAQDLAWLWVYGVFPTRRIEHIDGDKVNNRIANLREAVS